jgi:ComF family protein
MIKILKLLFPPKCPVCNALMEKEDDVCVCCAAKFHRISGKRCHKCGCEKKYCTCKDTNRWYNRFVAPFYYNDAAKSALVKLKRKGDRQAVGFFADAMRYTVIFEYKTAVYDLVTAVPMYPHKKRKKGFSHAALLAKRIAKDMNLPFEEKALIQIRNAKPQHELNYSERENNVLDLYAADSKIVENKTVLLVDDICTTGSTLNACARALKIAGASDVYCVSAAKTAKTGNIPKKRN